MYEQMRRRGPTWSPFYDGFWSITSYDGVRSALRDHETFSSASGCFLPDRGYRNLALEQDPPENAAFRAIFLRAVGRNAVVAKEDALRAMVERIVGEFVAAGGGDARAEISEKVPVEGICLMLGFSPDAAAQVREVATAAWKVMYADPEALKPMNDLLMGEFSERRSRPRDDFLTWLTTAEADGRLLSDDEIANILNGAIFAGHETTMNASSNLIYELARDPELQLDLRVHPDKIPHVVEECLRHRAPIHLFFRTLTKDAEFEGTSMKKGDKVALFYAGANRDPGHFPDPDLFSPEREDVAHLSFGWGIHRCVGSFLAQTELRLVTSAILAASDLTLEHVEMAPLTGGHHMGMERLDVTVDRRAPAGAPTAT
jgi:cytochrome P450